MKTNILYNEDCLETMSRIEDNTIDSVICDPFAGSGSTLVAAAKLGYKFIGSEIDAEYCTIANKRIDALTKQEVLF